MNNHKEWEREMSTNFSGMMDEIRNEPMPKDSLERSLEAAEAIVMTKAAYIRGYINAGKCIAVIYPIAWLIALGIDRQFDIGMTLAWMAAFASMSTATFPVFIWQRVMGRIRKGKVLLDCGPMPAAKRLRLTAALWAAGAIVTVIISTGLVAILIAAFLVLFALFFLIFSTGRLQICENGVFQYVNLMRWDQIKSYHWKGDTDTTLMIQGNSAVPFMGGRGALPVANEQKDAVDALLQKHLG